MIIDVSDQVGFGLTLGSKTYNIQTDGTITYERIERPNKSLHAVLRSPELPDPDNTAYYLFHRLDALSAAHELLAQYSLTYSPVLIPPQTHNGEFVKTHGHYHPPVPGMGQGYPEVYTQLYGRLLLFLQKRDKANPDTPLDCALIDMTPGVTITIPPEYAHVLINPTPEIALMAGLYSPDFKPEYDEVRARRGLAYYVLDGGADIAIETNPRYVDPPPLTRLNGHTDLDGTIFAPLDPEVPLWESYTRAPDRYAFLTQPDALIAFFNLKS